MAKKPKYHPRRKRSAKLNASADFALTNPYKEHTKAETDAWVIGEYVLHRRNLRRPWGPRRFRWLLVAREPWTNKQGEPNGRLVWQGKCAVCGATYTVRTGATGKINPVKSCDSGVCSYRSGKRAKRPAKMQPIPTSQTVTPEEHDSSVSE
jgi:hypothetical protein